MKFLTKLLGTYIAYSWGNLWGTTKKSQTYHISSLCTKLHAFTFPLTPNIFAFWRNNLLSLWRQTVCVRMIVEDSMPSRFQRANFQSLADSKQRRSYWKDWKNYKNCFFFSNRIHVHQISRLFVLVCHVLTDVVQHAIGGIRGKICIEDVLKLKLLPIRGRFSLQRVWVIKGLS